MDDCFFSRQISNSCNIELYKYASFSFCIAAEPFCDKSLNIIIRCPGHSMFCRCFALIILIVLLAACSPMPVTAPVTGDAAVEQCHEMYTILDNVVADAGVIDAEGKRIPGFPYLRSNRFLASLADSSASLDHQRAWLGQLIELDRQGRRVELANLPPSHRQSLAEQMRTGPDALDARLSRCAERLRDFDLQHPQRLQTIHAFAQVEDNYSLWQRTLGLYPLTRYPVYQAIENWKARHLPTFAIDNDEKDWQGRPLVYIPETGTTGKLTADDIARMINRSRRPPLNIPELAAADLETLAQQFAPVFLVDEKDNRDRIGRPVWNDKEAFAVDTAGPVVYVRPGYTWFEDTILLQLIYTLWFPERPESSAWDLLAGKLDGIIWRVTIDGDGHPLMADSIHPCGCYHLFFPRADLEKKPRQDNALREDNITPQSLPHLGNDERVVIRIASVSHYIEHLSSASALNTAWARREYALSANGSIPDHGLRIIPLPSGDSMSLYGQDGMVAGTERRERWLLWPMGVKSPGAMRQWGRHATAFIGRRHFDDPLLFENGFSRTSHE